MAAARAGRDRLDGIPVTLALAGCGDGAHISTSLGHWTYVHNGCTGLQNVPDGVQTRVDVCDWVYMTSNRNPCNCRSVTVTA